MRACSRPTDDRTRPWPGPRFRVDLLPAPTSTTFWAGGWCWSGALPAFLWWTGGGLVAARVVAVLDPRLRAVLDPRLRALLNPRLRGAALDPRLRAMNPRLRAMLNPRLWALLNPRFRPVNPDLIGPPLCRGEALYPSRVRSTVFATMHGTADPTVALGLAMHPGINLGAALGAMLGPGACCRGLVLPAQSFLLAAATLHAPWLVGQDNGPRGICDIARGLAMGGVAKDGAAFHLAAVLGPPAQVGLLVWIPGHGVLGARAVRLMITGQGRGRRLDIRGRRRGSNSALV